MSLNKEEKKVLKALERGLALAEAELARSECEQIEFCILQAKLDLRIIQKAIIVVETWGEELP